jgi:hypothetical protein
VAFAGADLQDGRSGTGPVAGRLDGASNFLDVGEVTASAAVANDYERLTVDEAAAEGLQGEVGALAGPQTEKIRRGGGGRGSIATQKAAPVAASRKSC